MNRHLPLLVLGLLGLSTNAQNWTVGTPVAEHLSDYYFVVIPASPCFPSPDHAFNFPVSNVTGVQHAAIVEAATPAGTITISPGPAAPLSAGDTVWITTAGTRSIYFPTGTGDIDLRFMAIGTPTTAGEPHPCVYNDLWLGFGLCPQQASLTLSTTCTVQGGSVGLEDASTGVSQVVLPGAHNGQVLACGNAEMLTVFDVRGNLVRETRQRSIDLGDLPDGVYVAQVLRASGERTAHRFVIAR